MNPIRFLFHVHTNHSFDGVMSVRRIVNHCRRHGIRVLAITDHDSNGAIEKAVSLGASNGVTVIPAIEYNSTDGDIVGLFCRDLLDQRSANETIDQIRRQGGIVILPHPAKGHQLQNIDVVRVDLIETFNARCDAEANQAAQDLAARYGKPGIAGADAHLPWDLKTCENELTIPDAPGELTEAAIREAILRGPQPIVRHLSPASSIPISQMVKAVKQRRPKLFVRQTLSLIKRSVLGPRREVR